MCSGLKAPVPAVSVQKLRSMVNASQKLGLNMFWETTLLGPRLMWALSTTKVWKVVELNSLAKVQTANRQV